MIETLILGWLLGAISVGAGAAYAAYRYFKRPFMTKNLSDGYEVVAIDKSFDNDECSYIAIRKNDNIMFALRLDGKGIKDIVYDI